MKREAKDKKYGFGGKKREKGQSDPRSLNDLSQYNPKQGGSGRSRSVSGFLRNSLLRMRTTVSVVGPFSSIDDGIVHPAFQSC